MRYLRRYGGSSSFTGQDEFDNKNSKPLEGPQPKLTSSSTVYQNLSVASAGLVGLGFLGEKQYKPGTKGWDYLLKGIRALEELSPGKIYRTFQVSNMLSFLETANIQTRFYSPEIIHSLAKTKTGRKQLGYISSLIGKDVLSSEIANQGFRFQNGKILLGQKGDQILLRHARIINNPAAISGKFQEGYVRSLMGGESAKFLKAEPLSYINQTGAISSDFGLIIGGQTRTQATGRFLSGYGTHLVDRINALAKNPSELPIIKNILNPVLKRVNLGVTSSTGIKTLAKLSGKFALLGGLGYVGYRELDYRTRESSLLDNTLLGEGITAGIATLGIRTNLALTRASEIVGLQAYREKQEEIAPGSTSLQKLSAFPIKGAIAAASYGYFKGLYDVGTRMVQGLSLEQASLSRDLQSAFFKQSIYKEKISEQLLSIVEDKTIDFARKAAEKEVSGVYGQVGRYINKNLEKRGLIGSLARTAGKLTPFGMRNIAGLALGTLPILPFLPGALIPGQRTEELEKLYSGEKRVAVRKGRWWEAGRSPYEGGRITRFREHWFPRLLHRGKEKSIWGEDTPSPITQWAKKTFTYDLEQKHYYDRPYPISTPAFQDIPFIGPLLGATIGKIVKPAKLMHEDEWIVQGKGRSIGLFNDPLLKTVPEPKKFGETSIPGELQEGVPISPFAIKGIVGEQGARFTEMIGFPGFMMNVVKEGLTGSPDLFDQEVQLEASNIDSLGDKFWDLDLGGAAGSSELIRRMYPSKRNQIETYNPIRNTMPDWLPGEGDKSENFQIGDPFKKIPEGEIRLPGIGYAASYPELKGIDPADYPTIHRLNILCLDQETIIPTSKEIKYIKNIQKGDFVFGKDGKLQKVKEILKRKEKDNGIIISTFYNYIPLICSDKHKILICNKEKQIKEIQAKEIKKTDYLLFPKLLFNNKQIICIGDHCDTSNIKIKYENQVYKAKEKGSQYFITFNLFADRSLGRIFGLYLAEGNISLNRITWTFNKTEKDTLGEEIRTFAKLLDIPYHDRIIKNAYQISINSKLLSLFFYSLFGSGSANKSIKFNLLDYSKEFTQGIIEGYFDGDGYIAYTKSTISCRATSISRDLLIQIRHYCLGLGIVAGLKKRKGRYIGRQAWTLDIQRRDIKKLSFKTIHYYKDPMFCESTSNTLNFELDNYIAIRIKSIKKTTEYDYWFDLSLDGEIHLFTTLQGIVHNSDIAPYSDKYKETLIQARTERKRGQFSEEDERLYQQIQDEVSQKKIKRIFSPYQYKTPARTEIGDLLAASNEAQKTVGDSPGWFARTIGSTWENMARAIETPDEFLTPLSPGAKLVHMRTAVEDYRKTQFQGTERAFWQNPIRDFIQPTLAATKGMLGSDAPTAGVQGKRDLEEYFDILKWVKYSGLKKAAINQGDFSKAKEYEGQRRETLFGVNPYTYNFSHIFRSLPRNERDYFNAFVEADLKERKEIMKMLPENQKPLMVARWKLQDELEATKAIKKGIITDPELLNQTQSQLNSLSEEKLTEGMPKNKELWEQYLKQRDDQENYANWYRRTQLLPNNPIVKERGLPGPDWVGFHPGIDLNDIKLKVVENLGENIYEYDLWDDRKRDVARRPIIEEAREELMENSSSNPDNTRLRIEEILRQNGIKPRHISLLPSNIGENEITLDLQEDRTEDIKHQIKRM